MTGNNQGRNRWEYRDTGHRTNYVYDTGTGDQLGFITNWLDDNDQDYYEAGRGSTLHPGTMGEVDYEIHVGYYPTEHEASEAIWQARQPQQWTTNEPDESVF
ncbi:MAG: hypothetical protein GY925_29280 [Actinomycetia bacterium]|nr:hypothetical protein [Actinomycetes bacterium]